MRFIDLQDHEKVAILAFTREEALQVVHDLINQLADAPGAGSKAHIVKSEDPQGQIWVRRLTFMLETKR
jgi:hypothetical protein